MVDAFVPTRNEDTFWFSFLSVMVAREKRHS